MSRSIKSYKMRAPSSGRESNYTNILKYMNAYMMAMNLDLSLIVMIVMPAPFGFMQRKTVIY